MQNPKLNDKDKVLSYLDLKRFALSQGYTEDSIILISDLSRINSLNELFGKRFFSFVFSYIENQTIGHFTLLSHIDDNTIEYYDSFGQLPDTIKEFADKINCSVIFSSVKLQNAKSFLCGKHVILRLLSVGTPLDEYVKFMRSNKNYSPDKIVDLLIQIKDYDTSYK